MTNCSPNMRKTVNTLLCVALMTGLASAQCMTMTITGNTTGNVNFGSSVNWANPNRSDLSDNLYSRTTMSSGQVSKYLLVQDFGYTIPLTATITGVEVTVEKHADISPGIVDASMKLYDGSSPVGTEHALATDWPTSDGITIYGSPADMWGLTLTPADVNSSDFGVMISASCSVPAATAFIDQVVVTVYYSDPSSCVLAASIVQLGGFRVDNGVEIQWSTATESNMDVYQVERSLNGTEFSMVSEAGAAGTSTSLQHYTVKDISAPSGKLFYRLKMIEKTGGYRYPNVIEINENDPAIQVSAFPNPSTGVFTLSLRGINSGAMLTVLDASGKNLMEKTLEGMNQQLSMDFTSYGSGIYFLMI